jgi:predicted nucleic-acid-binding protein
MAKTKAASLDTNTLLRLVLGDLPEQTGLVEELTKKSPVLHVADVALIEMVFVLEKIYSFSRADVVNSVQAIIRHPKINANRRLFERVLPDYLEKPKLSIVDCALVHYATLTDATPLFTFDKALASAYPASATLLSSPAA